jgi:hypothetical protein
VCGAPRKTTHRLGSVLNATPFPGGVTKSRVWGERGHAGLGARRAQIKRKGNSGDDLRRTAGPGLGQRGEGRRGGASSPARGVYKTRQEGASATRLRG